MTSLNDVVTTPTDTTSAADLIIGRVKWFNNKSGYGFITVTDGPKTGTDIFVHHSAIGVSSKQYKYLVQGEYVEFSLSHIEGGSHPFQAAGVCGIKNGKLMCETRRDLRLLRSDYKSTNHNSSDNISDILDSVPRSNPRLRGNGPREDQGDWSLVKKNKTEKPETLVGKTQKSRGRPPKSVNN